MSRFEIEPSGGTPTPKRIFGERAEEERARPYVQKRFGQEHDVVPALVEDWSMNTGKRYWKREWGVMNGDQFTGTLRTTSGGHFRYSPGSRLRHIWTEEDEPKKLEATEQRGYVNEQGEWVDE